MPVQFYPKDRYVPVGNNKRHSVVELKNKHPEKFGRFIMALRNLIDSDDWARICGIHGNTFKPCDKGVKCPTDPKIVTIIGETGEPFYCKHSVYSFIGWHTPYVYQFELLLNKHNKSSNNDYITLPWLDLTDYSSDFAFLNDPEITIFYDKKKVTIANPLSGAYYYVDGVRTRTLREGYFSPKTDEEKQELNTIKKQLNNALYATTYEQFSSIPTKPKPQNIVVDYIPLETPHNTLHDVIGGENGNMSSIDISAFDPIFWLHHCNMDRHYYSWVHSVTDGFKNSLYPQFMTTSSYNASCAPFFNNYIYSRDTSNYKWGWTNNTGTYMKLSDVLDLQKLPYTYDIIKPTPFVPLKAFVELIDIPIPRETVKYKIYLHSNDIELDRTLHFAGSAVWFGINRDKIDCCRCNVVLTNIKIDIESYVTKHNITSANIDNYTFVLEGTGRLIKDDGGKYRSYNSAELLYDGSYKIVVN